MTRTIIRLGVAFALLGLAACETVPQFPPPPSESLRASLGTVGVVSVGVAPEVAIHQTGPVGAGQGAAAGALSAFEWGGAPGSGPGAGLALAFKLSLVPFGAVVGAIVGANNVIPWDEAEEIKATISRVLAELEPQADLRTRIIALAAADAKEDLVDLGVGVAVDPMAPPSYATFAERGIQTVLEIGLLTANFSGEGGSDPDFVFAMSARARLARISDNQVLWSDEALVFSTPSHKFSEWKENDAVLLKTTIDNGIESLARRISDKTFIEIWSKPGG